MGGAPLEAIGLLTQALELIMLGGSEKPSGVLLEQLVVAELVREIRRANRERAVRARLEIRREPTRGRLHGRRE